MVLTKKCHLKALALEKQHGIQGFRVVRIFARYDWYTDNRY
jgi:hypothetical protein